MAGLTTILIATEDIIKGIPTMMDKIGRLDLLGQILFTGYGIRIDSKSRTPAELGEFTIAPFTFSIRGTIQNSSLTLALLRNASTMSGKQQLEAANELLEEHDIYLEAH